MLPEVAKTAALPQLFHPLGHQLLSVTVAYGSFQSVRPCVGAHLPFGDLGGRNVAVWETAQARRNVHAFVPAVGVSGR